MLSISLSSLKGTFFTLPIRQICIKNIPQPLIFHINILKKKKVVFYPRFKMQNNIKGFGPWPWKPTWSAVTQSSLPFQYHMHVPGEKRVEPDQRGLEQFGLCCSHVLQTSTLHIYPHKESLWTQDASTKWSKITDVQS